ncbi:MULTISPECIES: DUF333 domain-containing protein [unclassified Moraxella]|uniref:putative hemolysin n=1 Tax=unclassified Moraxella TaxID=2685852 RepID=UPI003AF74DA9
MKSLFLIISASITLIACTQHTKPMPSISKIANPASEFCVKVGGKSAIKTDTKGNQYGVCQFSNGQEADEWEFYRESAKIIVEGDTIHKGSK